MKYGGKGERETASPFSKGRLGEKASAEGQMRKKEREIRLENEYLSLQILPDRGGKIASIRDRQRDFELLYQPSGGYPPLYPGMSFSQGDASGFDDVFPSMGERYEGALWGEVLDLPDHGEIWTAELEPEVISSRKIRLRTRGRVLPYEYTREISLEERRVKAEIRIRNMGERKLPLVWVSHGLMRLEEDTLFEFPRGMQDIFCLGGCSWPGQEARSAALDDPTFSLLSPPPEGHTMKFYFREPVTAGECAAYYLRSGMKAVMAFDPGKLPWLGFWITTGGYRGERNFAFEPATAWYDTWSCAEKNGRLPMLKPGEETCFSLSVILFPAGSENDSRESNFSI